MARTALQRLIHLLRAAHAGERAAAFAYQGHARSLRDPAGRDAIARIEREEWEHRHRLGEMLAELGQRPARLREVLFATIGRVLSALCHLSGWYLPMFGAGWIEARNVQEYVDAAACARAAQLPGYARELARMADCEREHEAYFRGQVAAVWQTRIIGLWPVPAPETAIAAPADDGLRHQSAPAPAPGLGA
jgi:demethoxyubiquinone hydroxylase (CLK1/Coq7/Cat5 family)